MTNTEGLLREALEVIAAKPERAPDAIGITARNIARAALDRSLATPPDTDPSGLGVARCMCGELETNRAHFETQLTGWHPFVRDPAIQESRAGGDRALLDWPTLANIIREVDGNHDLGAGELAERIIEHPRFHESRAGGGLDER